MTKNELVSAIAKRSGISKADVEHVINNSLNVIRETVASGDSIIIRGFGTIEPKLRKAKKARIIATGETVNIPARKVPTFKPCFSFRQEVQNGKVFEGNNF